MMVRRMCGVSLKDKKCSDELLSCLGIEFVENKIQRATLRGFGHVERKEENNWVKNYTGMNVTRVVGRGVTDVKRHMMMMTIKFIKLEHIFSIKIKKLSNRE